MAKVSLYLGASSELEHQWWQTVGHTLESSRSFLYWTPRSHRRRQVQEKLRSLCPFYTGTVPVGSLTTFLQRHTHLFFLRHRPHWRPLLPREEVYLLQRGLEEILQEERNCARLAQHFSHLLWECHTQAPLGEKDPVAQLLDHCPPDSLTCQILQWYIPLLQEKKLMSPGAALREWVYFLAEASPSVWGDLLPQVTVAFLEYPYQLSPLEITFLEWAKNHWLEQLVGRILLSPSSFSEKPFLQPLEPLGRLFEEAHILSEQPVADPFSSSVPEPALPVCFTRPLNEEQEVRAVAHKVRHLLDQGLSGAQIAILYTREDKYLPCIEEIFSELAIPYTTSQGAPLLAHPLGQQLWNLLSLSPLHCSLSQLLAIASGPYPLQVTLADGQTVELSPQHLEEVALLGQVFGTRKDQWQQGLERAQKVLENLPEEERPLSLPQFQQVRLGLEQLLDHLPSPGRWRSLDQLLPHWEEFFQLLGFPARLFETELLLENPQILQTNLSVWQTFQEALEATVELLGLYPPSEKQWERAFQGTLQEELKRSRLVSLLPPHPACVLVAPFEEGLGLYSQQVFLLGMSDQSLHTASPSLLSKSTRQALGWAETALSHRSLPPALVFLHLLNETQGQLHLSCPAVEGDTPLTPTVWIEYLRENWAGYDEEAFSRTPEPEKSLYDYHLHLGRHWRQGRADSPLLLGAPLVLRQRLWAMGLRLEKGLFSLYDGHISDPWLREHFQRDDKVFSASQLDLLAKCPFRFFLERLLHLSLPVQLQWETGPLEQGLFLHQVLCTFYEKWQQDHPQPTPLREEPWPSLCQRLLASAQEVLQSPPFRHFQGAAWQAYTKRMCRGLERPESEEETGLLKEWLQQEYQRQPAHIPLLLEWSFGKGDTEEPFCLNLPSDSEKDTKQIYLQGQIDRIDQVDCGGTVGYMVGDYKTGKPPSNTEVYRGLSYQLPLYLLAGAQKLGVSPWEGSTPLGVYYFHLKRADQIKVTYPLGKKFLSPKVSLAKELAEVRQRLQQILAHLRLDLEVLEQGLFHRNVVDESFCYHCPARKFCAPPSDGYQYLPKEQKDLFRRKLQ